MKIKKKTDDDLDFNQHPLICTRWGPRQRVTDITNQSSRLRERKRLLSFTSVSTIVPTTDVDNVKKNSNRYHIHFLFAFHLWWKAFHNDLY